MTDLLSGAMLLLAAFGLLIRVAIGAPEVRRWPHMCVGYRTAAVILSAGLVMLGVGLLRGHAHLGGAGLFLVILITTYSVVTTFAALGQRRRGRPARHRDLRLAHSQTLPIRRD